MYKSYDGTLLDKIRISSCFYGLDPFYKKGPTLPKIFYLKIFSEIYLILYYIEFEVLQ